MPDSDPDMDAVLQQTAPAQASSSTGDPDMDAVLSQASQPQPSWTDTNVKRPLGLAARAAATGVAGLPLMAMNAGVGARNALTGSDYELPGKMFEDSLDQLGLPRPKGWGENAISMIESGLTGAAVTPSIPTSASAPETGLTASQQSALQQGQKLGMAATPGQQVGSRPLLQLESKLESQPWTSGPAQALKSQNAQTLNRTWAKAIGEDSDVVDSSTLARANDRLGSVFESVRDQRQRVIDPKKFTDTIDQLNEDTEGLLPDAITNHPLVKKLASLAQDGSATGQELGTLTSKLGRAATKQMTSPTGDRDLGLALFRVKDYTDDLVSQGLEPDELKNYNQARQQYRALMQLTARTGNLNPSTGNVSGANMASYLQKADKKGFLYGTNQSDAYNATRFAQAFKPAVGDSGTATRSIGLSDLLQLPIGLPANLLSRAYYKGWLTPTMPGTETLAPAAMGAPALSIDQSKQATQ